MNVKYTKRFKLNYERAVKVGFSEKINELLRIVTNNPFQTPPPYEKLGGYVENKYSRRINKQHRLVYTLKDNAIYFNRCWGHYDD